MLRVTSLLGVHHVTSNTPLRTVMTSSTERNRCIKRRDKPRIPTDPNRPTTMKTVHLCTAFRGTIHNKTRITTTEIHFLRSFYLMIGPKQ